MSVANSRTDKGVLIIDGVFRMRYSESKKRIIASLSIKACRTDDSSIRLWIGSLYKSRLQQTGKSEITVKLS